MYIPKLAGYVVPVCLGRLVSPTGERFSVSNTLCSAIFVPF